MWGFDLTEIGKAFMVLFAVIDIIGSIPLIIKLKAQAGGELHPAKASWVSLAIMLLFLVFGSALLNFIGIDVQSFAVAGSFILLALGLEMVLGVELFKHDDVDTKSISIVPLAFPLIVGAGTLTSIIALRAEFQMVNIAVAIVLNVILNYVVIRNTYRLETLLGKTGLAITKKVFGIILLAMAVKLFSSNIQQLF